MTVSFHFAFADAEFRQWLSEGLSGLAEHLPDGSLSVARTQFQAALNDKEFHGLSLNQDQVNYLAALFNGESIRFKAGGEFLTPLNARITRFTPEILAKADTFFEHCGLSFVKGGGGSWNYARNMFAERVLDTGTNVEGLETFFRSLPEAEVKAFTDLIALDFRSGGRTLEQILQDELSGRELGRMTGLVQAKRKGSAYYVAEAYGFLGQKMASLGSTPEAGLIAKAEQGDVAAQSALKEQIAGFRTHLQNKLITRGFAAELGLSERALRNIQDVNILSALLTASLTLKRLGAIDDLKKHYSFSGSLLGDLTELSRQEQVTTALDRSGSDFAVALKQCLAKIQSGESLPSSALKVLNTQMGQVYQEIDIFLCQEKAGVGQVESSFVAAEMASYTTIGALAAIYTGGLAAGVGIGGGSVFGSLLAGEVAMGGVATVGIGKGILVGTTVGTVVETSVRQGTRLGTKNEKFSAQVLAQDTHEAATNAFTSSLNLGASHLAGKAFSNAALRSVASSELSSLSAKGVRADTSWGADDVVLMGISGYIGSKGSGIVFEMSREVGENIAEEQLGFEGQGIRTETLIHAVGGALTELGSGGHGKSAAITVDADVAPGASRTPWRPQGNGANETNESASPLSQSEANTPTPVEYKQSYAALAGKLRFQQAGQDIFLWPQTPPENRLLQDPLLGQIHTEGTSPALRVRKNPNGTISIRNFSQSTIFVHRNDGVLVMLHGNDPRHPELHGKMTVLREHHADGKTQWQEKQIGHNEISLESGDRVSFLGEDGPTYIFHGNGFLPAHPRVKQSDGKFSESWMIETIHKGIVVLINPKSHIFLRIPVEEVQGWQSEEPPPQTAFIRFRESELDEKVENETIVPEITDPRVKGFEIGQEVFVRRKGAGPAERGWFIKSVDAAKGTARVKRREDLPTEAGFLGAIKMMFHGREVQVLEKEVPLHQIGRIIADNEGRARIHNPSDTAFIAVNRREDYLEKHGKMDGQTYRTLFNGDFKQSNVGVCYLLAAFNSLRRSEENFEALMRTSIEPVPDGFYVTVPLGVAQGQKIFISHQDLKWLQNPQFMKKDKEGRLDERPYLTAVKGALGFQVLEAAYIKLATGKKDSVDRLAVEGGFSYEALRDLLGAKNVKLTRIGNGKTELRTHAALVASQLKSFHAGKDVLSVYSKLVKTDKSAYRAGQSGQFMIYYRHAYSIEDVIFKPGQKAGEFEIDKIIVVNPHNTSKKMHMTYAEFLDAFYEIDGIEMNLKSIFSDTVR